MRDLEPRGWLREGDVRALRRDLRRVLGLSTLVFLTSVVAIPLLDQVLGALLSVIAGASLALLVGALIAYVLAPIYARQWQGAESRLSRVWPYIYRVTIWGLAAARIWCPARGGRPAPGRRGVQLGAADALGAGHVRHDLRGGRRRHRNPRGVATRSGRAGRQLSTGTAQSRIRPRAQVPQCMSACKEKVILSMTRLSRRSACAATSVGPRPSVIPSNLPSR
jgi:hypothetical protein